MRHHESLLNAGEAARTVGASPSNGLRRLAAGRWAVALGLLALLGCAGPNRPPPAAAAGETDGSREPWFCQMQGYQGWQCTRGAAAENPQPERLPEPRGQTRDTGTGQADDGIPAPRPERPASTGAAEFDPEAGSAPGAAPAAAPAPEAAPLVGAAAAATAVPNDLPAYVQLAYQPESPTALVDLPADFYAVQLIAMKTTAELEAFARRNDLPSLSAAPVERDGERYFVLLLGVYRTLQDAETAAAALPAPLADVEPWIRPLGSLQAAMRRAQALPD